MLIDSISYLELTYRKQELMHNHVEELTIQWNHLLCKSLHDGQALDEKKLVCVTRFK